MAVTQSISSRREMLELFNSRLNNTHSDLLENTRLEFGRNMLKTAIIESNIPWSECSTLDSVTESVEIDSDLYLSKVNVNSEDDCWIFVDIHDSRFWIVYSLEKSSLFNEAINDILQTEGGGLDRLWIPTKQVEEIGELGEYEGVKIKFGAEDVFPEEFIEDNLQFTDLNIDGSGQNSRQLYNVLKASEGIDRFLALSRIQIRRETGGEFVRERITNEGMFTTRGGTDVRLHVSTVENIKEIYSDMLKVIEENHIIRAENQPHGGRSRGAPIVIQFSQPVPNVEQFLSHVVNAQDPFRLWGHIRQAGQNSYKVDGVDAHNGDQFSIEMSEKWLRLYLYGNACGNTALRMFTNIQQYYDPAAELVMTNA